MDVTRHGCCLVLEWLYIEATCEGCGLMGMLAWYVVTCNSRLIGIDDVFIRVSVLDGVRLDSDACFVFMMTCDGLGLVCM